MNNTIINPILAGYYPDPSWCAVDGTYYLVNSSFVCFSGLPIFKSTDLCNWEQIGNVIDRPEQMTFIGGGISRGLFAPTIRYNGNTKKFYCICTNVDVNKNFFVTADKPEGPWSKPIWIPKAPGIDPSLFFDDDGTAWYCGTRPAPEGPQWNGNWEVYISKIDLNTGDFIGEAKGIWRGALKRCIWPEGPHIYKINGKYYLFHAEGGTGPDHAVCVAKCDTIDGEWIGKPANPILTHRHLGRTAQVVYVGHCDIIQTPDGKWWLVCLAARPYANEEGEYRFCNMGRETFVVPMKWEGDWPVCSWETGVVEKEYDLDGHATGRIKFSAADWDKMPVSADAANANPNADAGADCGNSSVGATAGLDGVQLLRKDDFDTSALAFEWISLRDRKPEMINTTERAGWLRLHGSGSLAGNQETSFVARRQTSFSYEATAKIEVDFAKAEQVADKEWGAANFPDGKKIWCDKSYTAAGLSVFQCEWAYYNLQIAKKDGKIFAQVVKQNRETNSVVAEKEIAGASDKIAVELKITQKRQNLSFAYRLCDAYGNGGWQTVSENQDATILSVEKAGGFVGTIIGMFAEGGGVIADFDWFEM